MKIAKMKEAFDGAQTFAPRIPPPTLPPTGVLSTKQKWESLQWSIKTAESHGEEALKGLALALSRLIQAEVMADVFTDARHGPRFDSSKDGLLWDQQLPINASGQTMESILDPHPDWLPVNLRNSIVFASPWEPWRMCRAMQEIGAGKKLGEWRQDKPNHQLEAWLPLPIVWVMNGNHSVTTGILHGEGEACVDRVFDASNLFKSVFSDGLNWRRSDNGEVLAEVASLPMAGIFEVARILCLRPFNHFHQMYPGDSMG